MQMNIQHCVLGMILWPMAESERNGGRRHDVSGFFSKIGLNASLMDARVLRQEAKWQWSGEPWPTEHTEITESESKQPQIFIPCHSACSVGTNLSLSAPLRPSSAFISHQIHPRI